MATERASSACHLRCVDCISVFLEPENARNLCMETTRPAVQLVVRDVRRVHRVLRHESPSIDMDRLASRLLARWRCQSFHGRSVRRNRTSTRPIAPESARTSKPRGKRAYRRSRVRRCFNGTTESRSVTRPVKSNDTCRPTSRRAFRRSLHGPRRFQDDKRPFRTRHGRQGTQDCRKTAQEEVRQRDTVARLGGGEFVIVGAAVATMRDASMFADRLLQSISLPISDGHRTHRIGVSIGVSFFFVSGTDFDTLLAQADGALYAAKHARKNQVRFSNSSDDLPNADILETHGA